MKCLLGGLCVCWSLILGLPFPLMKSSSNIMHHEMSPHHPQHSIPGFPDRCDGLGFDAITPDEQGVIFYFRDEFLWKGFNGSAEFINNTWPLLPTHIDAALRIHHKHATGHHDRMLFFKGNQVWQYYGTTFEGKFLIHEKFPGIPDDLEAAVECPVGECAQDSILFFKGDMVYHLNLNTTTVKARSWQGLGHCGAALRWLERVYCFDGTKFTRFQPSTGHIPSGYPKDARDYFMRCEGRGHASWNKTSAKSIHNRCSNESFEEFNEDQIGRMYAFRKNWYFRLDTKRDGWHPWPIHSSWPSIHGNIDGVFSWDKKMYFIQGSQLFIYKAEAQYTLIIGYPKDVTIELGIPSTGVDATFICPGTSLLYVIFGNQVQSVNLEQTPRALGNGTRMGHPHVDGAICNSNGVHLFIGTKYYRYDSPNDLVAWKSIPDARSISLDFMSCAPGG